MKYITYLFFEYGLIAMFFIILVEYGCFPISSEIVLPFSGAFASIQGIPFLVILPVSVLAGLIGTSFCYAIGRFGGNALVNSLTKRFPKTKKGMDSANKKFIKYGAIAVCIGRVIPICRTYIAFFAGISKLNFITYLVASAIGITTWNTLLIGLGYMLRENYTEIAGYYNRFKDIIIPAGLFIILFFIVKSLRKKHQA